TVALRVGRSSRPPERFSSPGLAQTLEFIEVLLGGHPSQRPPRGAGARSSEESDRVPTNPQRGDQEERCSPPRIDPEKSSDTEDQHCEESDVRGHAHGASLDRLGSLSRVATPKPGDAICPRRPLPTALWNSWYCRTPAQHSRGKLER